MKAIVIGGGIAGLSAAYHLLREARAQAVPIDLVLLEQSDHLGGIISTEELNGAIIENGPDSFITTKPEALALCRELGLSDNIIQTNSQFRRTFVAFGNKLHPLPEGFIMVAPSQIIPLLKSSLFSPAGKLRMLLDVVLPKPDKQLPDESVASFVGRRLGREALERVAQPMLCGIYTGDSQRLSLRSAMPQLFEYEQTYGSVIVGMQEEQKKRSTREKADTGARYSMFASLDRGMRLLPSALCDKIGQDKLRINSSVSSITPEADQWVVHLRDGSILRADAVIMAIPAGKCGKLLNDAHRELADLLLSVDYASSAVLNLVFNRSDIAHSLDGFGFVVPAIEKRSIIACSFSSVKFSNRAPKGMATLRAFIGGALHPEFANLPETDVLALAMRDLRDYLGIRKDPVWKKLTWCRESMPQYEVGHGDRVSKIMSCCQSLSGIYLAGNAYSGVGISDCIRTGQMAARSAIAHLQQKMSRQRIGSQALP